jgi:hypothetical protein
MASVTTSSLVKDVELPAEITTTGIFVVFALVVASAEVAAIWRFFVTRSKKRWRMLRGQEFAGVERVKGES